MADIVNLNKYRKRRMRAEGERRASENRIAFGRPKHEKTKSADDVRRLKQDLEKNRLDDDGGEPA